MEILANNAYGGFGLSKTAVRMYNEKKHTNYDAYDLSGSKYRFRTDKDLIDIVKKLGPEANDDYSEVCVVTIPDGSHFVIYDDDGAERVFYSESEIKQIM